MRAIRMAGLCLFAVAALAVAASSALAASPEWGQCVPNGSKTGEFLGEHCNKPAGGKGNYDWHPAPNAKPGFAAQGEGVLLQTPGGTKVTCAAATMNGTFTGPKTATTALTLIGCTNEGKECQTNPLKPGEIGSGAVEKEGKEVTFPEYEAELGFIVGLPKSTVGVDLKAKPPAASFFEFTCGKLPELPGLSGTIEGSVIGKITRPNHTVTEWKLTFAETGGKQAVTHFEGQPNDTLTGKYKNGLESFTEETGYKTLFAVEPEEAMEIKGK